jgi:MFS family permease
MSSLRPREANPALGGATAKFEPVFTRGALFILIALLLGETTVNFIDRQVVSVLAPVLRAEFHLSNGHYAAIVNAFMGTYALALPFAGWVLDRLGVGRGLTLAVSWWSASPKPRRPGCRPRHAPWPSACAIAARAWAQ